jgi:hypothetical protein
VVNKDSRSIDDVEITIEGLSGGMTATMVGLETSGSAAAGRKMPVVDGKFTDRFDGRAVHVYRVE